MNGRRAVSRFLFAIRHWLLAVLHSAFRIPHSAFAIRPSAWILAVALFAAAPTAAFAGSGPMWARLDTQHFGVIFPTSELAVVTRYVQNLETLRGRVVHGLGVDPPDKVVVRLVPNREAYESIQPDQRPPKWSAGAARVDEKTIFLFSPSGALREGLRGGDADVFVHELSHVYLYLALGERRAPRWLDEGVARMIAGEWSSMDSARLTLALLVDGLIPLRELVTQWPAAGERARLAYAESLSLAIFLRQQGWLAPLLAKLKGGYSVVDALPLATGLGLSGLEAQWKTHLRRHHTWLTMLNQGAMWFLLAVLLVLGWIVTKIRRRRQYERLDDDFNKPIYPH